MEPIEDKHRTPTAVTPPERSPNITPHHFRLQVNDPELPPRTEFDEHENEKLITAPPVQHSEWRISMEEIAKRKIAKITLARASKKARGFYKRQNEIISMLEAAQSRAEGQEESEADESTKLTMRLVYLSLAMNVLLFCGKLYGATTGYSVTMLTSVMDSALDLLSGVVVMVVNRMMRNAEYEKYPAGKRRFEPIGLLVFSILMFMSVARMAQEAIVDIGESADSTNVKIPSLVVLIITIVVKSGLFMVCRCNSAASASLLVLSDDHRNDVVVNSFGVSAMFIANRLGGKWNLADPISALCLCVFMMRNWALNGWEQVKQLRGQGADPLFLQKVTACARYHDDRILAVDTVLAFRCVADYLVEVHIVLDEHMTLRDVHDIAESLTHVLEKDPEIDRAYVHCDFETHHHPRSEHKIL